MKTHPPANVLSATLEDIIQATGDRDNAIKTLNAAVDVVASTGGGKEGKVTEYTSFHAYILMRKPNDLNFVGMVPVLGTKMLQMNTDGKTFTVVIPPKSKVITGSNTVTTPSENPLENLRPSVISDALTIRSAGPGELVALVSDDRIYQPDPKKKYMVDEPEYDLAIYKNVPGSVELKPLRVIHIGRASLLPFQQDNYDDKGQLVTQTTYEDYKVFGTTTYPGKITIKRPLDRLSLVLTVTKLAVNQQLEDDQFENNYPKTYTVQKLP